MRPGRLLVATPDYCWLRMPRDRGRYEDMTPRLVLNYEYYTYIEMILMKSFSSQKLRAKLVNLWVKSVSSVPPCLRSVPRVGDAPSPPYERKHNVTPKVSSVTPSSCWMVIDS